MSNVYRQLVTRHLDRGQGGRVAIRQGTRAWSYAALDEATARAAGLLIDAGVVKGDRVLTFADDSPELVALILGAWRLGAVAIVGNLLTPPSAVFKKTAASRARFVVVGGPSAEELVGRLSDAPARTVVSAATLGDCLADSAPAREIADVPGAHAACWQYTDGEGGLDLAVVHSHATVGAGADPFARGRLLLTEEDVSYSIAKLTFGYGFGNSLVFPLATGGTALLPEGKIEPAAVLDTIERERPTVVYGVPTFWASVLKLRGPARWRLPSVRAFVSAGEALPASLAERFQQTFARPLVNGLGSTEMFHIFVSTGLGGARGGAIGTATPGHDVSIRDADGRPVPRGQAGEAWVRGPHNGDGYAGDPVRSAAVFQDGWVRTGDLLRQDEVGDYHFEGRADDMVKIGGQKVMPAEVQRVLAGHPAVLAASLATSLDEDGLPRLTARVQVTPALRAEGPAAARILREYLRTRLLPHKCPRTFEVTS